jgi:hypothetical protein
VTIPVSAPLTVGFGSSGAGGLDTGSETNALHYVWLVWNPATETAAGMLSLSGSAPVMPSGYTKKRLLGAVANVSGNLVDFKQEGSGADRTFRYHTAQRLITAATPTANTWVDADASAFAPLNSTADLVFIFLTQTTGSSTPGLFVRTKGKTPSIPAAHWVGELQQNSTGAPTGDSVGTIMLPLDSAAKFEYNRHESNGNPVIYCDVRGFYMEV